MREFINLAALLLLLSVPAMPQNTPKAEVFGGYSSFSNSTLTLHGWNGSINGNINHMLGIKADFSGHYGTWKGATVNLHTITFGLQLSYRKNRSVVAFVHALFGGARASAGFNGADYSNGSFAMNIGGGLDWVVHKNFAVRVVQLDSLVTRFGPSASEDLRFSAGIVFRLGSK
jgi:hypothetical protein